MGTTDDDEISGFPETSPGSHIGLEGRSNGRTTQDQEDKVHRIEQACKDRDPGALRELAASKGGLVQDSIRRIAWPILLGCEEQKEDSKDPDTLPRHRDEDQVQLDVDRSFVYYPEDESENQRTARKLELSNVIITTLRRHPILHYFQGYHDIVQVLLLVLGISASIPAVARLSLLRTRDFMLPTMSGTEPHLHLLPPILYAADPKLAYHLSHTQPFFALPATLTLYSHQIEEYGSIARLFDFLLASEAVVSIYLFAVVVLSRKTELLEIDTDEPEMLHSVLSKLPQPLDLDSLIQRTLELYKQHPPETLPTRIWSRISSNSVLKTTRDFQSLNSQSLRDGEVFFEKQAAELERREALLRRKQQLQALARRYQRPAAYTSVAIFVAVIAVLFRGTNLPPVIHNFSTALIGLQQRAAEIWQRFSL